MLTITITGETPEDVKNQLIAFDKALTPGAKAKAVTGEKEEPEEKPAKAKTAKAKTDDDVEEKALTHEDAREAIVKLAKKLDWEPAPPKIQAFTKKFAKAHDLTEDDGETLISRIPQIPAKKLKAFIQAIKDESDI